ncbi:MAG: discoidin domain-containing protein [Bacteroidaceae bacterium]|nr:discoidin domain-containing protein [Bacteroidaceae bacterium]
MEKKHLKCWRMLLVLMAILLPMGVHAQLSALEDGKVYHFTNKSNTNIAMAATGLNSVYGVTANSEQLSQLWYATVTADYFTLRNLATGTYLKGNGQSSFWGLTADNSATETHFDLSTVDTYNVFKSEAHGGYGYAHYATSQGGGIVGWTTSDASQWAITTVDKTTEEIEQAWADAAAFVPTDEKISTISTALYNIFSDKACTTLNDSYADMTDDDLAADANYAALPAALQQTVKKVRDNSWAEDNAVAEKEGWDSDYAKKFRVQMYEPYSIEGEITGFLRINRHNNMDNPTGIFANYMQPIYIMVEGDILDGAELWIGHINGHGQLNYYNSVHYTELNEGLNIIPYLADGTALWINYVVHTYNSAGTDDATRFPHKLSSYKPLKIHIEGGHINGYYNAIGDYLADKTSTEDLWGDVDNDADWTYYKERASTADFTLLGHRQTLQFELNSITDSEGNSQYGIAHWLDNLSVPSVPYNNSSSYDSYTGMGLNASTGKINIMLEAWDRIHMSELATMGVISDSQMATMNDMYPRWTDEGDKAEIYDYTGESELDGLTYRQFCGEVDYSEYFNHHGVALGAYSGYMSGGDRNCNYHYNTLGEIIGGIANVAGYTWGPAHEIGHQHQGIINLNGQTEVTNNLYANIAVWYMGMATSRVNGSSGSLESVLEAYNTEDNNAYTNNIWALTHMYYRLWLYYHLAGKNTQFFPRLMELCRRDPLQNGSQIAGSESLLKFYKHCCVASGDDLTEFFRAHGYLEVMDNVLIGDYSNGTYNQTQEDIDEAVEYVKSLGYEPNYAVLLINDATGETGVQHDGTTARAMWDGSATAEYGSYLDVVDGTLSTDYTATMNEDGTVTMSGGEGAAGFLIFDENGELLAFANKSTFELSEEAKEALMQGTATISYVATDNTVADAEVDMTAMYKALLVDLMNEANDIIALSDDTYTRVGFYMYSAVKGIETALATAQTAIANGTGYGAAYEILKSEIEKFEALDKEDITIPFSYSGTFIIKSRRNDIMYLNESESQLVSLSSSADESAETTRWQFIESDTEGAYYIKSVSGYYLPAVTKSTSMTATQDDNLKGKYIVEDMNKGVGLFAIKVSPYGEFTNLHDPSHSPNKVVGWTHDADNSQWYLTKVEQDATELNTIKLEELIRQTEELINNTATIGFETTEIGLTTTQGSDYYIWCNAPQDGSDVADLLDNDPSSFFHSNWQSTTAPADGLDHHLTIELGNNAISMFQFHYQARSGDGLGDYPTTIKVQGSNDGTTYTDITTINPLNNGTVPQNGAEWTSETIQNEGYSYKYLRFMVTGTTTNKSKDGHIFFHMAEFDLLNVTSYTASYNSTYSTVNTSLAVDAYEKMWNALVLTKADDKTEDQLTTAYSELEDAYKALADAIELVDNNAIEDEKERLQDLLDETTTLIGQVGTANIQGERPIDLHGKIYAHEPYTIGGTSHDDYSSAENDYNLLDGNTATYFHSDYSSALPAIPYLQVDLGEGNEARNIIFQYTTRSTGACCPTEIKVYGRNFDLGDIATATTLNNITTATRIAVKNVSGTNNRFFAGTSNIAEFSESVIFVWEPVNESTAGSYYLRLESAGENGYIQTGTNGATLTMGAKSGAQTFYAVTPTTSGSGVTKFSGETLSPASASENIVRLAAKDDSKWINVAAAANAPYFANTEQFGGYTVHNIYLIEGDGSVTTEIATYTSTDGSNPLPTEIGTWNSGTVDAGAAYRFYKFAVTASESTNNYGHFFVMSEFGMTIPAVYEVSVDAAYTALVSEELLATTQTAANNASSMLEMATTVEQLQAQYDLLLAAKNTLSDAANNIEAIKAGLQEKIDATTLLYNKMAVVTDGTTTVSSDYTYTAVEAATLQATATELAEAQTVMDTEGLTADDIATATNELDVYYQKLLEWEDDNADRTELSSKIVELNNLLGTLTTTSDTETAIALQCTNANADYYIWTNAQEASEGPIANLLDNDSISFFHSNWSSTTAPADGLDHHLTVNLGNNAISSFKFHYQARSGSQLGSYPSTIKVQGSKDGEEYIDLAIIEPNTDAGKTPIDGEEWTSDVIGNGTPYSYLRFMVTATKWYNQTACTSQKDGHVFFHMAKFDLISTGEVSINDEYVSLNFDASLITDAFIEKTAKQVMHDSEHLSAEYNTAAIAELQAVIDALTIAKDYAALPVQLTTDTENPVLYNILINRAFNTSIKDVISYEGEGDAPSDKVAVEDFVLGDKYQGWYFTPAADGKVNILPMQGEGKMLSTNSYVEGTGKVVATEPDTEGYGYDWSIDAISDSEWYNISILNGETPNYLSNIYGKGNLLGFYNSDNTTDGGSQFKFELADYSKSDAYCTLYNYHVPLETVATGNYINTYSNGDAYNTAYNTATELLEGNNSDDDTYTTAYNTLKSTYEALEKNEIVDEDYYVIRSANPANNLAIIYGATDNMLYFNDSKTTTDPSCIWKITKVDGGYNFTNLNTGTSMIKLDAYYTTFSLSNIHNDSQDDDAPSTVVLEDLGKGQFRIKPGGTWLHAQSDGKIVRWYEGGLDSNSAWYIEPADETAVTRDLAVSKYEWTSLHLGYAVTIPDAVKAYYSTGVDGSDVELVEIADGVIPANTGVLINAPEGTYELKYTTTDVTYDDDNALIGCNHDIYVEAANSYTYYVLAIGASDNAALCYIYKEVSYDENGNMTFTENDDNGTHFKLPAHKVYLPVENATNIRSFGFRVIDGTTGIDGVTDVEGTSQSIYDLSGRKLHEVTAPGIYIVNGKKVFVNKVK